MRFIRLFLRGLKDAYDQFVLVIVVSALWWLSAILIVPGPPATVALFRMIDPRNQIQTPDIREFFRVIRENFRTGWGIAAFTVPVILVLLWNAAFFQGSDSFFALMVPLWLVMAFIVVMLMLYAFATAAAMDAKVRNAFRGATYLLVMWPFSSALMMILLTLLGSLFAVLVLPLIFFGPGVSAAVINRFALTGFNVEIIDPEAPTSERRTEVAKGLNPDDGGWLRRLRGGQHRQEGRR
ncbi:MAG TPA: DUF624 domain-containing protein [Thermomicrobiales bacterium]|nr:DUF624 domain-containing protein [Thermomicrobiales bacterium]